MRERSVFKFSHGFGGREGWGCIFLVFCIFNTAGKTHLGFFNFLDSCVYVFFKPLFFKLLCLFKLLKSFFLLCPFVVMGISATRLLCCNRALSFKFLLVMVTNQNTWVFGQKESRLHLTAGVERFCRPGTRYRFQEINSFRSIDAHTVFSLYDLCFW